MRKFSNYLSGLGIPACEHAGKYAYGLCMRCYHKWYKRAKAGYSGDVSTWDAQAKEGSRVAGIAVYKRRATAISEGTAKNWLGEGGSPCPHEPKAGRGMCWLCYQRWRRAHKKEVPSDHVDTIAQKPTL